MAIGSLIVFVGLLALIATLLGRLWADDTVVPVVRDGLESPIGVGDSVALGTTASPSVAKALVAATAGPAAGKAPPAAAGTSEGDVAVAAGRAVSTGAKAPPAAPGKPGGPPPTAEEAPVEEPVPAASEPPGATVVADVGAGPRRPLVPRASVPPRTALGGAPGSGSVSFEVADGGEYRLSFTFSLEASAFREPGAENLLLRVRSAGASEPPLGLQLWEFPGDEWYGEVARGLWTSGEAAGGERFLAPLGDGEQHRLDLDFRASSSDDGYYVVFLDGAAIDSRAAVSLVAAPGARTSIEAGLFRDAADEGPVDVAVTEASLTETTEPVAP
jgi:hypothetical protein